MFAYYEDRLGVGLDERALFGIDRLEAHSGAISNCMKQLSGVPAKLKNGKYPILLDSGEGWRLLDKFVLGNLDGDTVDAEQSHFRLDDFKKSLPIAHSNFNLHYNQRKPMSTESFNFSSQGTPSQEFTLIKDGKLTEPICNLKIGKKLGYKAKALSTLMTDTVKQKSYADFVQDNETFILIFGVMGVHTAKTAQGNYSLPAPDALLIKNGKVVGPLSCVISGNFFDVLMQTSTQFIDASHMFDSPALSFETQVTVK